ncbi:MAG TPA: NTP transferase domain-containing protein [Candidatus Yaniella excrementavium]|nr:NTP transferase domain-containing protein [Candidatus Yaniella excrementavium]
MAATEDSSLFAIILAGGASSRLHATSPMPTVDKPLLELRGKSVLTHVIEAAATRVTSQRIVVVGPASLPTGRIATVYEQPPRSGPYMGVYTGLQYFAERFGPALESEAVLLLGADMPNIAQGLPYLLNQHNAARSANVVIAQAAGRLQPLLSSVPRSIAEHIFAKPLVNTGLMQVLRTTQYRVVEVPAAAVSDVDTYQDAIDAGITF